MANLNGLPGGGELLLVDGAHWYVKYDVPGTNTPMLWHVPTGDDLKAFGGGSVPQPDRRVSSADLNRMGAVRFGSTNRIKNTSEHPFDQFMTDLREEAKLRPWLREPEIVALAARAVVEGRPLTLDDLRRSDWWRSRTEQERAWAELDMSDPKTARQRLDSNRIAVRDAFLQAGYGGDADAIADHYAGMLTTGKMTEVQLKDAIRRETDPFAPGASPFAGLNLPDGAVAVTHNGKAYIRFGGKDWLMTGPGQVARYGAGAVEVNQVNPGGTLKQMFDTHGISREGLQEGTNQVRSIVQRWLGPAFAGGWNDEHVEAWASRMRRDPNAKDELENLLRQQRKSVLPEYDENLSYDDIAAPWRAVVSKTWGQQADETDPLFMQILRLNDLGQAEQLLRREGRKRGIEQVIQDAVGAMGNAFGGQVKGSLRG